MTDQRDALRHPIQPMAADENGTVRFKQNKIVDWLWREKKIDLNEIAMQGFPWEDQQQFAQLLGYSLNGYGDLGYVDHIAYDTAYLMSTLNMSSSEARIVALEGKLAKARAGMQAGVAELFDKHPEEIMDPS